MVAVSVVVPTHNRAALLRRCLAALATARAACIREVEIVVVDDGSRDETSAVIATALEQGQVNMALRNERPQGPASARNRGWRVSTGKWVAFTDDDCEVHPAWLEALVGVAESVPADVAGVGGRVRPATDDLISAYMTTHRILEPPSSLRYVVTANCIFRRTALEEVGGFDEAVRAPGGEDPGLCLKLGRLGHRFSYEPSAMVMHHYRPGFREFLRTFYRYGKGCRIVMDT